MAELKQPKIEFKNLKGFAPVGQDVQIHTLAFLDAAREIVAVIESFGKLFIPVVKDMQGNIDKIATTYQKDTSKFANLDQLLSDDSPNAATAASSLLWLHRALHLICKFFENILNDPMATECLKEHLQSAYEATLKPYHGWFVQHTVTLIYRWVPSRSQLLGRGYYYDENVKVLESFLPAMRTQLFHIDDLLKAINFE